MKLASIYTMIIIMASSLLAQKSTEQFIPIGMSPGLSGEYTVMGTIDSVSTQNREIYMHDSSGASYSVNITDKTKVYLDKSMLKKTNATGSYKDCRAGTFCEIFYEDYEHKKKTGNALWIKIRVNKK